MFKAIPEPLRSALVVLADEKKLSEADTLGVAARLISPRVRDIEDRRARKWNVRIRLWPAEQVAPEYDTDPDLPAEEGAVRAEIKVLGMGAVVQAIFDMLFSAHGETSMSMADKKTILSRLRGATAYSSKTTASRDVSGYIVFPYAVNDSAWQARVDIYGAA